MEERWKKPARSEGASNCVEISNLGAVRDSKNPTGPALRVQLPSLLTAARAGRLDHLDR